MAELKLLDPNRKAVLSLPDPAFKLWATYWFFESDDQEAYPSLDRLQAVTGQSRNTLLKWRDYLLETGWLVKLTGYASDRYSKPTRGSHSVAVYRVDDPNKQKGSPHEPIHAEKGSLREPIHENDEKGFTTFTPHEMNPRFIPVSLSLSLSEAVATASPTSTSADADIASKASLRDLTTTSKATTKTKAKTPVSGSEAAMKHNAKYDVPFPYDFGSWSQPDRTRWCVEHSVSRSDKSAPSVPSERRASPPNSAPPPKGKVQCPHCEKQPWADRLESHIREWHIETLPEEARYSNTEERVTQ